MVMISTLQAVVRIERVKVPGICLKCRGCWEASPMTPFPTKCSSSGLSEHPVPTSVFAYPTACNRDRAQAGEGQRERESQILKQPPGFELSAQCRARTHEPRDHDLSRSRMLNRLSHPAPAAPGSLPYLAPWPLSLVPGPLFTEQLGGLELQETGPVRTFKTWSLDTGVVSLSWLLSIMQQQTRE
ncbi:uncharacterized protein LOC131516681 isoform X2 [Neofelis nebulosa]|uniref:uncharacterized protein LOC131516681 isoform X2 n=1 Tax=Neofelis nebulosa TaxID=61452 RepID=UPI00272CDCD8|nr:uncharacterized protein LOC131516681 isoform X2 [Neofelis nebulosa]